MGFRYLRYLSDEGKERIVQLAKDKVRPRPRDIWICEDGICTRTDEATGVTVTMKRKDLRWMISEQEDAHKALLRRAGIPRRNNPYVPPIIVEV